MAENYKSIFNDVLGPVMVGASSSHVAAAARIGRLVAACLGQSSSGVRVEFCQNTSLAYTYHSHGSDMGFAAGLIGMPMDDTRVPEAVRLVDQSIDLRFVITEGFSAHPNNYLLSDFAIAYESARGSISGAEVLGLAEDVYRVMENACAAGQQIVPYANRILGSQAHRLNQQSPYTQMQLVRDVVRCVTAVMESKSAMRPIVAAPTAGACGCVAGTLCALSERMQFERSAIIRALLSAGLVGVFFCDQATFAAEVGGCGMECGAACAMAAAAVTELFGGSARQCLAAASMALQGITGLACDPVAGRVEVPCLNKNVLAGVNAMACATMALADFDQVVPLFQTIDSVFETGKSLPQALRCTYSGLGLTPASAEIQKRLDSHFPPEAENSSELR